MKSGCSQKFITEDLLRMNSSFQTPLRMRVLTRILSKTQKEHSMPNSKNTLMTGIIKQLIHQKYSNSDIYTIMVIVNSSMENPYRMYELVEVVQQTLTDLGKNSEQSDPEIKPEVTVTLPVDIFEDATTHAEAWKTIFKRLSESATTRADTSYIMHEYRALKRLLMAIHGKSV